MLYIFKKHFTIEVVYIIIIDCLIVELVAFSRAPQKVLNASCTYVVDPHPNGQSRGR